MATDFRVTWWDRLLIGIAPEWGARRLRARAGALAAARHYEAAQGGRRTEGWHRSGADANAANGPALKPLREISRDLKRNNGWARNGVRAITRNTVGWGIMPKPDDANARRSQKGLALWKGWAGSTACDFNGRLTFYGLERLVMDTVIESGEALVVQEFASTRDRLPIPMRIRVLEPDHLDSLRTGAMNDGTRVEQGIEFDKSGRRVAYWIFPDHPGGSSVHKRFESVRVPAERVLHVYYVERPDQHRGVPWLCAAIAQVKDLDDFEDAELMQRKIAACFGAFVKDADGMASALGEEDDEEPKLEELQPGLIQYLPPGRDVSFATPPAVTETSFSTRNLRRIAAALGVTYEDLTGDYSQVNFSSARMARLAHWANVYDWRWNMIIPQFCDGVWRWAMEMAQGLYGWPDIPTAEWVGPPMPMIDPDKEGIAYQRLVRSGAMTLLEMIQERGLDPMAHLDEIERANAELDARGIVLDSDPRKISGAGGIQGSGSPAGPAAKAFEPKAEADPGDA